MKAICIALVALLPGTSSALASDSIIVEDVTACCAVSSQTVLCARGDSVFGYSMLSSETYPWTMDFDPAETGWAGTGTVRRLAEAAGTVLVFIDLVPPVEEMYGMSIPAPVGIVSCAEDGSGATLLALTRSSDVQNIEPVHGGGYVSGTGFSRSAPDAEHYLDYVTSEMALDLLPACNLISTSDGTRYNLPDLDLSVEHTWCPYSPRVVLERQNPVIVLLDTEVPEADSTIAAGDAYPGISIRRWVTVDAMTASYHGTSGLLFVDGRFAPLPVDGWTIYRWLTDGSYIYSREGVDTLYNGFIDWSTFETKKATPQPGLGRYMDSGLITIPDSPVRLLHLRNGTLRLLELAL